MHIHHARTAIALHELSHGDGLPLLLLHALGESSAGWGELPALWPGQVLAVDFSGHGESEPLRGGGYWPELLLGDADIALEQIGQAAVIGAGFGAYIALLLAGARPTQVHGAILADGPGLAGGPTGPTSQSFFSLPTDGSSPDPYALVELGRDLRPPDYAASFVRLALAGSALAEPIAVTAVVRPDWLDAVAREHGVMDVTLAEALAVYVD